MIIDDTELESYYHEDAINLGCGNSGLLTDFSLTNSTIKIPAESSHAVHFHCKKKGYHYNAQIAFTTFGFNTAPKEPSPTATTATPTSLANSTTSTTTSAFSQPFQNSLIYVDVEGSVRFANSPCNRLKYTDKEYIEHKVPLNQTLFVTEIMSFEGLLAITENNEVSGTYFTHENHQRIIDDTFDLQEQCPVALDQYNAKKLSNFLPSNALIQSRLGGPPVPVSNDETDWKSKYEQQKTYTAATIATTGTFVVTTAISAALAYRYRKLASSNSHRLMPGD